MSRYPWFLWPTLALVFGGPFALHYLHRDFADTQGAA